MLKTVSFNDSWRLGWFEADRGQQAGAHAGDFNDGGWIDARVPGEVHLDLQREKIIRGTQFDKTVEEDRWMEKVEWWYRRAFTADAGWRHKHVELVFDGLDTLATVWLNGKVIARNDNMYSPVRCDISDKLRWGKRNVLAVRLAPTDRLAEGNTLTGLYTTTSAERLFVRKAQVSYGWDFNGRSVTAGIWWPVRLECWDGPRIDSVHVVAEPIDGGGEFRVAVETRGRGGAVEVAIRGKGKRDWQVTRKIKGLTGRIRLKNAKLWWPFSCGKPNLYEVRIRLLDGKNVLDEQTHRVGVRKIELVEDPIEDGTRFGFRINGRELYIRGANWVPPTAHLADADETLYRSILARAVEGNIEMLRVWGGGVYEYDSFYDLCDEMGILVWQDFMWACGVFPETPPYQKSARREAEHQVRRLRNHACLCIWCGNNEDDWAYDWGRLPHKAMISDRISRGVLPEVCAKLDPDRPYVPSSPFSHKSEDPNCATEGDQHQYRWQGFDPNKPSNFYERFFEDRSRFVSEFGSGSLPSPETMHRYNFSGKDMPLGGRFRRMAEPRNTTDPFYGKLSGAQFMHGQFQKRVLEHYRRLWPVCGGTLHWKFNDPFSPNNLGFSLMASVDPLGVPKLSYYYAKRAYAPVTASLKKIDDRNYTACVCNGTAKPFRGTLRIDLHHQDNSRREVLNVSISLPADTSMEVGAVSLDAMGFTRWEDQRDNVAAIHLSDRKGEEVYFDTQWFMDIAREPRLVLIWGTVKAKVVDREPARLTVELKADRYIRPVELLMPGASPDYSDNFLDLLPNVPRTVTIRRQAWETVDLTNRLLVIRAWNCGTETLET